MDKMNAITFAQTGHLLGVVTRKSQPDKAASPEDIAAGGFILRSTADDNLTIEIPEEDIGVVLVDYDTRILYRPHLFAITEGEPEQKKEEKPPKLSITLDGSDITVTLPTEVNTSVDVWCRIAGSNLSESITRAVTIPGTADTPTKTGTECLNLGQGDYRVAMFAPGYAVSVFSAAVS